MEMKLKNEDKLNGQIQQLIVQRDKLKSELEDRQSHSSAESENLEEYEFLRKRLESLTATTDHLEDEITKAMAINSILIERMGDAPRVNAYRENSRLRNEKRRILNESLKISCDLLAERAYSLKQMSFSEVGGDLQQLKDERGKAIQKKEETEAKLEKIISERHKKLFDAIRVAALDSFAEYDQARSELERLTEREKELKMERKRLRKATSEEAMSEYMIEDAKNELRNCQSDLLRIQYDIYNTRAYEVQLKYENEVMRARRAANGKIDVMKAKRDKLKARFLELQLAYNEKLTRGKDIDRPPGMDQVETEFATLDSDIQKCISEEAHAELGIEEREFEEMQGCNEDIMKWISDQHLACLASQARYEALERQITVLQNNGGDRGMQDLIAAETEENEHLNAVLVDSNNRLRALDVMMGGEDSDEIALDARFQSIQERIATILQSDEPVSKLNAKEQELRETLNRLKRNRK